MSYLLGELTEADRADVAGWLERQELQLRGIATKPPQRVHETGSVAIVDTAFQPGPAPVPVRLTVYKEFGRVRIEAGTPGYAPDVADRVALTAKAHPKLPVFADLTLADWLLWRHPELAGRIEYDARLELLTRKQLLQLFHWRAHVGAGWRDIGGCPAIVVADPLQNPSTVPALVAGRGVRTVYRSSAAAIVVRTSRACGS
jgi:hypothetical protein